MSNKLLRQHIRKLLLETNRVRAGVKHQDLVGLKIDDSGTTADQRGMDGILKKDFDSTKLLTKDQQMDHRITHLPEYKKSNDQRKLIKSWWNDRVYGNSKRKAYFSNSRNILCIHWLGMYSEDIEVAIEKLPLYLEPLTKVHELSTIGYLKEEYIISWNKLIGIEYKKRRITFAYEWDAATEFLSSATKEIHAIHRGSGIHKRPNTHLNVNNVIFDQRDVDRKHLTKINECIIDNYSNAAGDIIIHINPELEQEDKDKIERIIKSYSSQHIIKI